MSLSSVYSSSPAVQFLWVTMPRCRFPKWDFQMRPIVLLNWELCLFFQVLAFFPGPGTAIVPQGSCRPIVPPSSWPLMQQNKTQAVCKRRGKIKKLFNYTVGWTARAQLATQHQGAGTSPQSRASSEASNPAAKWTGREMSSSWWLSGELSFQHFPIPNAPGSYRLSLTPPYSFSSCQLWKAGNSSCCILSTLLRIGLRCTSSI